MSNEAIGAIGYLVWFLILFIGNLWYTRSRFGRLRWDVAFYYAGAALMATGFIHAIGYVIYLATIQYK